MGVLYFVHCDGAVLKLNMFLRNGFYRSLGFCDCTLDIKQAKNNENQGLY